MKNTNEIRKESKKIWEKIKANEEKIIKLTMIEERRAAAATKDFAKVKELRAESESTLDEQKKLSDEIQTLQIKAAILADNLKAAFFAYAMPIVLQILAAYEGKKYGEKTKEKIREAAKAAGIGFYFERYFTECTTLVIYELSADGYQYGNSIEIRVNTSSANPFITSENVIQAASATPYISQKYTENPGKKAREILKAFSKLEKAHAAAKAAESEYNNMIPENMKSSRAIDYSVRMF